MRTRRKHNRAERRGGRLAGKDRRQRFNIGLKPGTYRLVTKLADETDTNCTIVVRNLVDYVVNILDEPDELQPFMLSLIGERTCTLEIRAPVKTAKKWRTLGMFHGLMGRRGFCTWALEAVAFSFTQDRLKEIIKARSDIREALETCLKA